MPKKKKADKRTFSPVEYQKMKKFYDTYGADPGAPKKYKDSAAGKAAYKRAAKGKTSVRKKG